MRSDAVTQAERIVGIASQIYEVRSTLRAFSSEETYKSKIASWSEVIRKRMETERSDDILDTALYMAKAAEAIGKSVAVGWITSAAVEMIEAAS